MGHFLLIILESSRIKGFSSFHSVQYMMDSVRKTEVYKEVDVIEEQVTIFGQEGEAGEQ